MLAPAAPAAAATAYAGRVSDLPPGARVHAAVIAHAANLPYGGGDVLHWNRTHVVFWEPAGSGMSFDPGYQSLIERFLQQVAADSHKPTNVYSLSGQYTDADGPAGYASVYGGAVLATDPLPANGCAEPPTAPGWTVCLSDAQLEHELEQVIAARRLPTSANDVYFLITPNGLGDCEFSGPTNCALGGSAVGSYCGYHSFTPGARILYAVIPYNAVSGHCQSGRPRPNTSTADPAVSTISHEHNEMVTDPLGDAWIDGWGREDGDLCITSFGPSLGGSGDRRWNQSIDGGHYWLQEEWSNDDSSCRQREETTPVSFSGPRRQRAGTPAQFTAHATDPDGTIVGYLWTFGDARTARGRSVSHVFARPGTYRMTLRTTDSSRLWAFASATIRVG
jgi:hypothetical protein